ncbi:hypothetical protein ASPSYDRAFT_44359 [Aspergillus sydowii CBS 593.65]|uniref:Uncharacterized protein n=1 Tax=Aspergillus sydowii CBS 593.65 TaxID=1036612 RepID=A0A1L9TKJ9_9EURO|nr:uncharacterized protein ASPSYDRAFT_44359 [Aspergillus sydowii CBS 593.65]OJJ59959.1 hypothetical protein ASPSYDRAFT_44359 [Aspergillus sydowii CBS 593.65]
MWCCSVGLDQDLPDIITSGEPAYFILSGNSRFMIMPGDQGLKASGSAGAGQQQR